MKNYIYLLIFLFITFLSCNTFNDIRLDKSLKVYKAFSIGDTSSLYNLIDTNFYFIAYGKEGFLFQVDVIKRMISNCDFPMDKKNIEIHDIPTLRSKEYILKCCTNSSDSIYRFDLILRFPLDIPNRYLMDHFEIKKYYKGEMQSTIPAPIDKSNKQGN